MDLTALTDFNLVAAHGGFGRASRASGRSKATLSRRVAELEEGLGVRLIDRGARSLSLTEEGRLLHERTDGLLGEIKEVGETLSAGQARPRGRLRINAPILFSHLALGRIAADFIKIYPDVILEVTSEDRPVDLVEGGYDVAIRINPSPGADLVGRRFALDEMLVVAPPSMVRPAPADDPTPVAAAMFAGAPQDIWRVVDGEVILSLLPDPRIRASSLLLVRDAVLAGVGVAMLPRSVIGADVAAGTLVRWGSVPERSVELWVLHLSRRLVSTKISAFVDFICDAFPDRRL